MVNFQTHSFFFFFFFFFFLNFILFFNFTIFYWFCHISTWICHRYTRVSHPEPSSLLPPPYHPSGSSQCTSPKHPVLCIEPELAIRFIYDIIHVSMPFSQIIPPSPTPTESKRLFYTSVSLLLSHIQGYRYHLSKFHIYALVYQRRQWHPTPVFLPGESQGQGSLMGCHIWGSAESDTTEQLSSSSSSSSSSSNAYIWNLERW